MTSWRRRWSLERRDYHGDDEGGRGRGRRIGAYQGNEGRAQISDHHRTWASATFTRIISRRNLVGQVDVGRGGR